MKHRSWPALSRISLRLRPGACTLQRHLATANVVAENSMLLINCKRANAASLIERMLAEMARQMRMQRAYLMVDGDPERTTLWQEDGIDCPPDWPGAVLSLPLRPGPAQEGVTMIGDVRRLPDGISRTRLLAAGVRGWVCIALERPGGLKGVIGFDATAPIPTARQPCRSLLRVAADVVANVLEREALERERAGLLERTERSRRVQTIGVLTSGIAHNFNNVIGSILGYAQIAAEDVQPGTPGARHLGEIRRAAESGRDLIEGILAFGNQSKGARPVRVSDLLADAGSLLSAALPSTVELAMQGRARDLAVFGDPVQLQQVLINLCSNASQAMNGRGCVQVHVALETLPDPRSLSHGDLPAGRYVRFCVRDTGSGFDAAVGRRLFEPFFTTKRAGTGQGLATVREIVRDHDGAIRVESTPGVGSNFEVWLPAEPCGVPAPAPHVIGRGETVLLVDAEPEQRLRAEEMLAALGFEPVGFERAEDALDAVQTGLVRIDAAVVGCMWPRPRDLKLVRALCELLPGRPILLAASVVPEIGRALLTETGLAAVLKKPLERAEIAGALARLLRPVAFHADQ
jgi:signal transduction histidine kinase